MHQNVPFPLNEFNNFPAPLLPRPHDSTHSCTYFEVQDPPLSRVRQEFITSQQLQRTSGVQCNVSRESADWAKLCTMPIAIPITLMTAFNVPSSASILGYEFDKTATCRAAVHTGVGLCCNDSFTGTRKVQFKCDSEK